MNLIMKKLEWFLADWYIVNDQNEVIGIEKHDFKMKLPCMINLLMGLAQCLGPNILEYWRI